VTGLTRLDSRVADWTDSTRLTRLTRKSKSYLVATEVDQRMEAVALDSYSYSRVLEYHLVTSTLDIIMTAPNFSKSVNAIGTGSAEEVRLVSYDYSNSSTTSISRPNNHSSFKMHYY
jgi:hypothetical protein